MNRRGIITGVLIVLATLLVVAVFAPRREAASQADAGRDGTLALRSFLRSMGVSVSDGDNPQAAPGTFLLLSDFRDETQARALLRWASGGGHLVVADPQSVLLDLLHVDLSSRAGGFSLSTSLTPGCVAPSVIGVRAIEVASGQPTLVTDSAAAVPCFPVGGSAFEIDFPRSAGSVTVLGGPSPLTNAYLSQADNATFALRLLGPGPVVFGEPLPAGAAEHHGSIWAALPATARGAIVGLCLAAIAYCVSRGRRLGKPVLEDPIAPIPAGELVHATAGLYRRGHHAAFAGRLLRRETTSWLARRLGSPGADAEHVAAALQARSSVEGERASRALLGPDPASDVELMSLARDLEELRRSVEVVPR